MGTSIISVYIWVRLQLKWHVVYKCKEQSRPQHGTLWHTAFDWLATWHFQPIHDTLRSVWMVWFKPAKRCASYAVQSQLLQKHFMINNIKSFFEVRTHRMRRLIRVCTVCLKESIQNRIKMKKYTGHGLVQLIRLGGSIRQIWVKCLGSRYETAADLIEQVLKKNTSNVCPLRRKIVRWNTPTEKYIEYIFSLNMALGVQFWTPWPHQEQTFMDVQVQQIDILYIWKHNTEWN